MGLKNILEKFQSIIFKNNSFSQEGEDLVVSRLFCGRESGFFVDVGAHHPFRFSNTAKLYRSGWHGVNIEPNPNGMKLFRKYRTRDANFNIGISAQSGSLKYYIFNDSALNTFDRSILEDRLKNSSYFVFEELDIELMRLTDVLDSVDIPKSGIDLLSVDVEGFDLPVLQSLDWIKYRPKVVVCEVLNCDFADLNNHEICVYLFERKYKIFSKLYNSVIFISHEFVI